MYQDLNLKRRPCGRMIIDHAKGKLLEDHFKIKYPDFKNYVQYNPIKFSLMEFINLLKMLKDHQKDVDGFRIYLGKYFESLCFIFTPVKKNKDVEQYILLYFDDAAKKTKFVKLPTKQDAIDIVANYGNDVLHYTDKIVAGNTRSYLFGDGLIDDFCIELKVHTSASPIKQMSIKLGAYPDNDHSGYKNRIMIGFSFLQKDGSEIGPEEISDDEFGCIIARPKEFISADTGIPCPPGKDCGSLLF